MISKILFWEKWALQPDDPKDDLMHRFEIENDPKIRQVIREFESKTVIKRLDFDDVHPSNSSVKTWINKIFNSDSEVDEEVIQYLIDTFRFALYPRSKKKFDYIVGILLLHDTLILLHSKKIDTLVESDDRVFPAEVILSAKNVLRAAIIKDEDGKKTFSAFEYNRRLSKGHADFWQIAPDDVNWEALGNFSLSIDIDGFDLPISLSVNSDNLEDMVSNHNLTPTGKIHLGRIDGKVTKAKVLRNEMDFNDFYEFYVLHKENLNEHQNLFSKIIPTIDIQSHLHSGFDPQHYEYFEDFTSLMKYTANGEEQLIHKEHPRFSICYFTNIYPRIKPKSKMIDNIYQAIFNNHQLEVWHAGEHISNESYEFGSLKVYNELGIIPNALEFGNNMLNIVQDLHSRKERLILQYLLCEYWKNSSHCKHFPVIFDHITQSIIKKDIEFEFNVDAISATEQYLEYKSPADVSLKKKDHFVEDTLVPTVRSYLNNGTLSRYGIIYGVEDNGVINPIYHLQSDMVTTIQEKANEILRNEGVKIRAIPIPFNKEMILLILLVPAMN